MMWLLRFVPAPFDQFILFVKMVIGYIWIFILHLVDFPFLPHKWGPMLLVTIPTWAIWYMLLTQPKKVDEIVNKICEKAVHVAEPIGEYFFSFKHWFLTILGFIFFPPLAGFAFVFSRPWLSRLVLTIGVANFITSDTISGKTIGGLMEVAKDQEQWYHTLPVGWIGALVIGSILLMIWWNVRSEEYKIHFSEVIAEKGWVIGIPLLLLEDFLPKPTHWKCTCGYKVNALEAPCCEKCGARNPKATTWICPQCKTENRSTFCKGCGEEKPEAKTPQALKPAPGQSALTPASSPLALPAPEMETCPHCGQEKMKGAPFCPHCPAEAPEPLPTSAVTASASLVEDERDEGWGF